MTTVVENTGMEQPIQKKNSQPIFQRIVLLIILGYEAAGCLLGGALLIAGPDGRYMKMPVEIMHGVFYNFLVPGIILFGLGILNTLAFASVLRRTGSDWLMAGLSFGGLLIWFVVEIIILQDLHWLHLMWGVPVLLGCVFTIPLIILRHDTVTMRKALLSCGIVSSLWYVAINIFVPMQYKNYNSFSFTVSELSAIGAPTRILWVLLVLLYPLFFAAFGWVVLKSAGGNRTIRNVGILIVVYSILNFYWPPMHRREVIAAGGGTLTDTLHIVWAVMTLLLLILQMVYGAMALGKRIRRHTMATIVIFIIFGVLTFMESSGIEANQPTPWMGLWERINITAFMLWVILFATALSGKVKSSDYAMA